MAVESGSRFHILDEINELNNEKIHQEILKDGSIEANARYKPQKSAEYNMASAEAGEENNQSSNSKNESAKEGSTESPDENKSSDDKPIENDKSDAEGNVDDGGDDGGDDEEKDNGTEKYEFPQARLQFPLYVLSWLIYFILGILPPLTLAAFYWFEVLVPHFFYAGGPQTWNTWWYMFVNPVEVFNAFLPILQDPLNLVVYLTIPIVVMGLHLFKMFNYALIVKIYLWGYNLIRKRKELKNALPFGETRGDIEVYHARNFILKVIKWEFLKSPYPWLLKWMYNFVGTNKIAKSATIEEGYVSTEFLEVGENAYVGYGTVTTAHLVEGGYGALTLKKIKIDDNACVGPRCAVPPGAEFGHDSQLLWHSGVIKYQKVRRRSNYWGLPASRLSRGRYRKILKMSKEEYSEWRKRKKKERTRKKKQKNKSEKQETNNKGESG